MKLSFGPRTRRRPSVNAKQSAGGKSSPRNQISQGHHKRMALPAACIVHSNIVFLPRAATVRKFPLRQDELALQRAQMRWPAHSLSKCVLQRRQARSFRGLGSVEGKESVFISIIWTCHPEIANEYENDPADPRFGSSSQGSAPSNTQTGFRQQPIQASPAGVDT